MTAKFIEQTDQLISQLSQQGEFSGVVLIAKDNEIILKKSYGAANIDGSVCNTINTKWGIASISKSFTAMLILLLAQENKLRLDDPVQKYIKEFKHSNVTLYHLLTNTSGLPQDAINEKIAMADDRIKKIYNYWNCVEFDDSTPYALDKCIEIGCRLDLAFEPGTHFKYSNLGYQILTKIIDIVDAPYEKSLNQRIFKPLGMTNSSAGITKSIYPLLATEIEKPVVIYENGCMYHCTEGSISGDGSIISTVNDLYLWIECIKNNTLLTTEYAQKFKTPFFKEKDSGYGYACGLEIDDTSELYEISHEGSIGCYSSLICTTNFHKKKQELIIIILSNAGPNGSDAIAEFIYNLYQGADASIRILNQIIPAAIGKLYEGHYQKKFGAAEEPEIMTIRADKDDTLWFCFYPSRIKMLQEKEDVFSSNLFNFTITAIRNNDIITGINFYDTKSKKTTFYEKQIS